MHTTLRIACSLATLVGVAATPSTAVAQSTALAAGAATITESAVRRHIMVIADDSMQGRDTPSRGLEMTARYIAGQFRLTGLAGGGDNGGFVQRYPLSHRTTDPSGSQLLFLAGEARASLSFEHDARYVGGARPPRPIVASAILLGGPLTAASIDGAGIEGRTVLLVIDYRQPLGPQQEALEPILHHHPAAIVLLSNRSAAEFAERVQQQFSEDVQAAPGEDRGILWLEAHDRALTKIPGLSEAELATIRASLQPVVRPMPRLVVTSMVSEGATRGRSAPNVVGILQGSDSVLRHEYVVFSAHMDHIGVQGGNGADSIFNGADDDASGTAAVVELAAAFARARPKRSLIFLTVSGEEKGLIGSEWFAGHPPVPIHQIVADLNMDMIGRNWRDTIVAIGKEQLNLGTTLDRVNAAHPELDMTAIDDLWPQESFYFRSDHFNFARRGVPILFFFNGTHADYHSASDSPEKIDFEKESRIVKLVYFIGQEVANAPERPIWDRAAYRKIVGRP